MSVNSASITLVKGSSQYLTVANNYNFTAGTFEAWIKLTTLPSATGYSYGVFSTSTNGGTGGIDILINTANKALVYFGAGTQTALGTTVLTTGTWYHISAVWTTSDKKILVNGVVEATNSNAETLSAGDATAYIGNTAAATTRYADMKVDNASIWNTNLSAATILANMSTELAGNETNLQGYWALNSALTDGTSGAHTLTNVGSAAFSADVPFAGSITFADTMSSTDTLAMVASGVINASDTMSSSDALKLDYGMTNNTKNTVNWSNLNKS